MRVQSKAFTLASQETHMIRGIRARHFGLALSGLLVFSAATALTGCNKESSTSKTETKKTTEGPDSKTTTTEKTEKTVETEKK